MTDPAFNLLQLERRPNWYDHLAALIKLHEHGAIYHTAQGNSAQARLWRRDSGTLQNISRTRASISIS